MPHVPLSSHPADERGPFTELSAAARVVWAKYERKTDSWLPLWRHMADSGAVAGMLWEHWVPRSIKESVAEALPAGETDARMLVGFLAAVHDAGKATPAFACQVEALAARMRDAGLEMPLAREYGEDRRLAPHGLAGQLLLQEWMSQRFGLRGRVSGQFAVVAGGHHGTPPDHQHIHDLQLRPHLLRHPGSSENVWRRVQYELMDACAAWVGVTERLPEWQEVRLAQPVQVILTAVVIVSDWVASSAELFPYDPETWQPAGPVGEQRRLRAAWEGLDLPAPWHPEEPLEAVEQLFAQRFPRLKDAAIRPVQAEAVRVARAMPTPGMVVIEAPMGEGKTEAAFAAAEVLAARSGAGGVLVALPTRATGDAMFPRFLDWLGRLPDGEVGGDGRRSVVLAHAKAALNELWAGLLRRGQQAIVAVDLDGQEQDGVGSAKPSGLHAHQWLRGRKKQLLASFAVTTIDQLLFAGLKSRHLALRHLAVAGKVVIIDEAHAYDAYMGRYLDRVLEWLAAYRVPVVLLSATLPSDRRRALVTAYAASSGAGVETGVDAYPLITAVSPGHPVLTARPSAASGRLLRVVLERLDDDVSVLADRLERELALGGCALVVRNTVDRVLEAADVLRERLGTEAVTVAHSRFLAADRAAKDAELVRRFGPDQQERPSRHVVVASQVAEQSLDIDFDLLVTDLAPVDLVLQRMGRLHRHRWRRPPRLAQPRCLVTGVDWVATPPSPVKGTRAVYRSEYALLRSLAVLGPYLDGVALELPDCISPLVQTAYGEQPAGPSAWSQQIAEARVAHEQLLAEKREKAGGFLLDSVARAGRPLYGWLEAAAGDVDDSSAGRAQVRDSAETLEVLVVQRQADGRLTTVPWLNRGRGGLELPTDFPPSRRAAEAVAASALTLPGRFSTPWMIDRVITELEQFLVPAWQVKECPWLAGELILVLDADCQTRLAGFLLTYSRADGLRVTAPGVLIPGTGAAGEGVGAYEDGCVSKEGNHSERRQGAGAVDAEFDAAAVIRVRTEGSEGTVMNEGPAEAVGPPSFDLVSAPWLPVQRGDGTVEEVSLLGLFEQADSLRRLVGDVPTQEIALLRMMLAILYDALDGPAEVEDWEDLWLSSNAFSAVPAYLEQHRDRFNLFDPERPFYQVAGLRTEKGEVAPLSRIVADVPVGEPFFAMRRPGVASLSYAEAARWLVHAHAYDTSGIKSAMVNDERAKAGKVYPLGVGTLGNLGGILAEGATLRETLLLNLIALEEAGAEADSRAGEDMPVWRRSAPLGAGERKHASGPPHPAGLRDLYTWQSRRIRLHAEGGVVTGVVLGYGDPLTLAEPWKLEPMSGWRRNEAQEKKQGRTPVYTPLRHDPSRAAWRGLGSLLPARRQVADEGKGGEPAPVLRSGIARWFTRVIIASEIDPGTLVRLRFVGTVYGTQQSVIDEIVDDSVLLPVVTLHEANPVFGAAAVDAVSDAEDAVRALGQLAGNLARAAGSAPATPIATARDMGFGALDGPYRAWLKDLLAFPDLEIARQQWRDTVRERLERLSRQLLTSAGPAADEGRLIDAPGQGGQLMDAGRAELWFRARLHKVLGPPPSRRKTTAPVPAQPGGTRFAAPNRAKRAR
ncbi:type I-E CRISPR-associated protein Cse1/CasA [Streptomyces rapamycinicus]|uniref:Type I-E CRISPR-associated protein Cse1/CasA n=1 Tax=Streptomyces rapamycinicus (strain ATCC 29253 / DSM 41530 / NRRL 5491 / AYB-994) TaxID=1343740 RepID=A0A3L8RGA6_STRRN|nr:type I-E CRISPR-associated protein Cse1/CasA [Streptomyces rapamycinicus]RLV78600.1 type I-E CRISPR-associated protein Cse1/CasA [Streptomyces rapamycinicus NRRL 5491]UTO66072.1 type I-E CRISPR-associated protein Cse1/CasA [Streptomyces rapamycinicus]UTP34026.1 type I-E CRISPR-associated protein Cse1/CasA [Streptomyces rapamycinicus NRRL 5491]